MSKFQRYCHIPFAGVVGNTNVNFFSFKSSTQFFIGNGQENFRMEWDIFRWRRSGKLINRLELLCFVELRDFQTDPVPGDA